MSNIGIVLFGGSAIWFVGGKEKWKRWGYILGLCTQPFWFWTAIENRQWGVLILSIWYTYSWLQGIYNYWIKTKEKENEND